MDNVILIMKSLTELIEMMELLIEELVKARLALNDDNLKIPLNDNIIGDTSADFINIRHDKQVRQDPVKTFRSAHGLGRMKSRTGVVTKSDLDSIMKMEMYQSSLNYILSNISLKLKD